MYFKGFHIRFGGAWKRHIVLWNYKAINMKIEKKSFLGALRLEHNVAMVKECRCPLCALGVDIEEFRNKAFIREFETTGLCQGCLDMVFGYKVAW
jgi:hypothetical protein